MIDILLPRTDGGVAFQLVIVVVLGVAGLAATWRNKDLRTFVIGVIVMTFAWMALRTVH